MSSDIKWLKHSGINMHNFELPVVLKEVISDEQVIFSTQGKESKAHQSYRKSVLIFGTIWIGGVLLLFIEPLLIGDAIVLLFFLLFVVVGMAWGGNVKKKLNKLGTSVVIFVGTTQRIIKYKNEVITSYEWSQFVNMTSIHLNANHSKKGDLKLYLKIKPQGGDFHYKRAVTNGDFYVMESLDIENIEEVFEVEQRCFESINKTNEKEEKTSSNDTLSFEDLHPIFPKKLIDFFSKENILFVTKSRRKKSKKGTMMSGIMILIVPTLFSISILLDISAFLTASISLQLLTVAVLGIFFWLGIKMLYVDSNKAKRREETDYYIGSLHRLIHLTNDSLKTIGWNEFAAAPKVQLSENGREDLIFNLKGGYKRKSSFIQRKIEIMACSDIENVKEKSTNLIDKPH